MPAVIKFSLEDVNRCFVSETKPQWDALASKIESLYRIPASDVGVSYVDADGDTITLSSNEELQDYYRSQEGVYGRKPVSGDPNTLHRFQVLDFRRRASPRFPGFPYMSSQPAFAESLDEGWAIPHVLGHMDGSDVPHAFVEAVDSCDEDSVARRNAFVVVGGDDDTAGESLWNFNAENINKGKGKGKGRDAGSPSVHSTSSVVDADTSTKHPVHVYDVSTHTLQDVPANFRGNETEIAAESTPKAAAVQEISPSQTAGTESAEIDDPPLPSFEPTPNASFTKDIASLISTLSSVVSSHPELSGGFRSIIRNISNGVYWHSHREAVAAAVSSLAENAGRATAEAKHTAEVEAGKRIAEAIGSLFRVLSQETGIGEGKGLHSTNAHGSSCPVENHCSIEALNTKDAKEPCDHQELPRLPHGHSPQVPRVPSVPDGTPRCSPPPPPRIGLPASCLSVPPAPRHPYSNFYRPNFFERYGLPNLSGNGPLDPDLGSDSDPDPDPSQSPPPSHHVAEAGGQANSSFKADDPSEKRTASALPTGGAKQSAVIPIPEAVLLTSEPCVAHQEAVEVETDRTWAALERIQDESAKLAERTLDESEQVQPDTSMSRERARVEAAKLAYKAEKERYYRLRRKAKEAAREEALAAKTSGASKKVLGVSSDETGAEGKNMTQIVSNARGVFPQLELVSVPHLKRQRSNNPSSGTQGPPSRREKTAGDSISRSASRIRMRFREMGFTETTYPTLPAVIQSHLAHDRVLGKDGEDAVVTKVLEKVLEPTFPHTRASGSGAHLHKRDAA